MIVLSEKSHLFFGMENHRGYLYSSNTDERNNSKGGMEAIMTDNSILVLGSSELSASDDIGYPQSLFKYGKTNFNVVLAGRGYMQSLLQGIKAGAYGPIVGNRKVVLIISPQWFTPSQASGKRFDSVFFKSLFQRFLYNRKISKATKEKVSCRAMELSSEEGGNKSYIENALINAEGGSPVKRANQILANKLLDIRSDYDLYVQLSSNKGKDEPKSQKIDGKDIDYRELLNRAQKQGEKECTNNDFGIYDRYYNEYIAPDIRKYKGSSAGEDFDHTREYDDLRLFLQVCKESGLKVLLVSMPVNGRWYDYVGFSKGARTSYYRKIREIAGEYNVSLADFSDREYELYFLKDTMHCGWKGWVYVDEAIYQFYLQK